MNTDRILEVFILTLEILIYHQRQQKGSMNEAKQVRTVKLRKKDQRKLYTRQTQTLMIEITDSSRTTGLKIHRKPHFI